MRIKSLKDLPPKFRKRVQNTLEKQGLVLGGHKSRSNGGKRKDLENRYFRSSWEANFARSLNLLLRFGLITKWEYEPDTFEFHVKRGNRFYTPDFKVWETGKPFAEYWEVKGWMDPSSKTKLKRMAKYYPNIKVNLVDRKVYKDIEKRCKHMCAVWE